MRAQFRSRVRIVFVLILLAALGILVRLYFIQIVNADLYADKADRQFASGGGGLFDRGSIYFTRKDGSLISAATLATGFLVAVNPQTLTGPKRAYDALSEVASSTIPYDAFLAAAAKKHLVHVEVAHRLSSEAGRALAARAIPGVEVLRESWRYYPGKELAAQSVGIVSYGSGDTLVGQTGLEAMYDGTLARSGDGLYQNFFAEIFSNVGDLIVDATDVREGDVITSIEPEVQTRLEKELREVHERYASLETGGIIMVPATGAIVALAALPSYDPNALERADPARLGNPLAEHVYEFGSIMKPITMAAALDSGAVAPGETYVDTGCVTISTARLCNWDGKARNRVSIDQIIVQSLNVGASWLAAELGQERLRDYFTTLFGEKTGVDLPSETGALLGNLSKREQVGYHTAAFGQGVAVTPLQMIRAFGALANGGQMVSPRLASAVRLNSGIVRALERGAAVPVFSEAAVRETARMMTKVVDEKLRNGEARIPTMSVAAKTGTAQRTKAGGGYYTDRFFHSFAGFFPSYNPRFVLLLYTNDPKGVEYASETLDGTFLDLVRFLTDYYAVPPDRGLPGRGAAAASSP